ncbi:hypothetical protein AXE65_06665 [Ventosimonas gracilis]|uniref:Abasic site processing protein n=1 Tax=Ventosimonas gracilis TaxID=1680762 RepID=A0A139SK17_9GAMM|nr:SOS response-associated peptidase [Ventosimonas gracilis]KXU34834.1 hypothetical protein AXE65_06665 [Ventosimonas gracilis]
MCGRYALFRWTAELAALPGFPPLQPAWNLAPKSQVLLLRRQGRQLEAASALWGLTPPWLTDLSHAAPHARAETLASTPMFREAFARRRGLLPANGFYEWRGMARKRPYWLRADEPLLYFAALWENWPAGEHNYLSVALITVAAGNKRRPLILDEAVQSLWLDQTSSPAHLAEVLQSPPPALRERALSTLVNDPALNGPECLTPA